MKLKPCIYSQPNYLTSRTAIEALHAVRQSRTSSQILFAVYLIKKQALTGGKILAREDKCSKKIGAVLVQQADRRNFEASAVLTLVYFYILCNNKSYKEPSGFLRAEPLSSSFEDRRGCRGGKKLLSDKSVFPSLTTAPINDEAKKHNENLPGMGGIYNTVNLHVYHYAGNNPVKYVDPDGDKILDVSTTLFQESGGAEHLGESTLTISGYGCVLTAYTRIGNAIGISEDITLLSANRTAKNNIFVGEDKNLLDRWNSGPKLVNRIGEGSGNMLKFDKSLTNLTLNEYGAALEEYKNSFDTYAVTIRLSSGHTVNMNTDGIIRDDNGNYTIKINNTSNLSTHNAWKPEGMDSDVIDKNIYIERIDVFKVEFNGNFNKNILLPN